jgi:hypothetical protein
MDLGPPPDARMTGAFGRRTPQGGFYAIRAAQALRPLADYKNALYAILGGLGPNRAPAANMATAAPAADHKRRSRVDALSGGGELKAGMAKMRCGPGG